MWYVMKAFSLAGHQGYVVGLGNGREAHLRFSGCPNVLAIPVPCRKLQVPTLPLYLYWKTVFENCPGF